MKGDPHPWEAGRGPGTMCRSSSLFRWWSSWPSYDHDGHHLIIIVIMTIHHGHLDHHDYFDHSWKNADASVLFFKPVVIFVVIFCFFTCKKCFGLLCWQVEHKLWSKDLLFHAHCNNATMIGPGSDKYKMENYFKQVICSSCWGIEVWCRKNLANSKEKR